MKTLASPTKITCVLINFIWLIFSLQTKAMGSNQECKWVSVDHNDIAEILTMIGDRVRENNNKLITWQGKIKIVHDSIDRGAIAKKTFKVRLKDEGHPIPDTIIEHQEFTREFALDVKKNLLYENYYPDIQKHLIMDFDTGRPLQLKENIRLGSGRFIQTADFHIDCMENKKPNGVIAQRTVIKQKRPKGKVSCQNKLPTVFDPRETMIVFGNTLWKTFANYLAYIDKNGPSSTFQGYTMNVEVKECEDGDVKKYKIVLPSVSSGGANVYISFALVCSSDAGFNVISYLKTADYDKIIENKTWDYSLINGVYIPVKQTKESFDYPSGDLNDQSTLNFAEQKVNEPIPAEVFTYKNLGLQNGDKFIDRILGKEYTFQDGELVPVNSGSSYMPEQTIWPFVNLNGDCCVNWEDLIIIASRWLDSSVLFL